METIGFKGGFLVRLDRGEEITVSLERVLAERGIRAGTVTGLGGIRDAVLGYYDPAARTYERKAFPGNAELVHYTGNITVLGSKPFVHAHAVISGQDFQAHGGHFFEAVVAVTGEFVLFPTDWRVERLPDENVGLNLMRPMNP